MATMDISYWHEEDSGTRLPTVLLCPCLLSSALISYGCIRTVDHRGFRLVEKQIMQALKILLTLYATILNVNRSLYIDLFVLKIIFPNN